ncbi:putative M1 family aminopeptidase 1 [Nosema granulosis]|uniref:Aminopeptidase n=1 Tax=Nosema granulosis TaxID=83296 RepID=A0A9P6GXM0_9MICR|nr:putative M1 family aminopeptidase 1 [Nosema granulosis]
MLRIIFLIAQVLSRAIDRLEHDFVPTNYDLYFDLQDECFKGDVVIEFKANKDSKIVNLNANSLDIKRVSLETSSGKQEGRATVSEEVLTVSFDEQLEKDKVYKLSLSFSGKYSKNLDGIYKSKYLGKTIISTHFEPTTARKAFPCFDQPDLKATFSIRVKADENYPTVLSNSSKKDVQQGVHIFNKTIPMATYLVAFVVGDFDYIETKSKSNIPIRIYTDKTDKENARFALEVAREALDFFELYFDFKYQFPKLDMVPIPSFAMGAMENWGLVTFRRSSLLYDPKIDTTMSKFKVAETVCHELAHMWFGNLVTMAWWNDLWLNEGFATWASFMALHNISSKLVDLDVWMDFINENLEQGMTYDSLHSSHPIAVDVKKPSEISQIFDSISYSKGASILRMLEIQVGHQAFRKNIQKYLDEHKLKNSVSENLLQNTPSPVDNFKMLYTWIKQEGFPIIKVREDGDSLILEQTRFLAGKKNNGDKNWIIPLTVTFTDEDPRKYIMNSKIFTIPLISKNYKINYSNTGVYRVLYTKDAFERILRSPFSKKEKLNVINDMFSLAFGGYLDIKWVVETIRKNVKERNYEILKSLKFNISKLYEIYFDEPKTLAYLSSFLNEIFSPFFESFDFKNSGDKMSVKLKNSLILAAALKVKDSRMLNILKKSFEDYKKGKTDICPDYLQSMFNAIVDENLDWVIETYRSTNNPTLRIALAKALGNVRRLENLEKMFKNFKQIDRQDLAYFLRGLFLNYKFKKNIVDFFIDNFKDIKEYINNDSMLNSIFESVLCGIADDNLRKKVESFTSNLKIQGSDRSIRKINEINYNLTLFKNKNKNVF